MRIHLFALLMVQALISSSAERMNTHPIERRGSSHSEVTNLADENLAINNLDVNKVRQFVTNEGRLMNNVYTEPGSRWDWPKDSGHEVMYRSGIAVGIPGNVVHSVLVPWDGWDFEWRPLPGYHNAEIGMLALSTDTTSWPHDTVGNPFWPKRDSEGNPIILSHQDSYGVYDDGKNKLGRADSSQYLNIEIHQHSYAWNTALDEDYIIFAFDVINKGAPKESLYFCHHNDMDAGSSESPVEYSDDMVMLDRNRQFYYQWDADNYTALWDVDPYYVGVVFLETPEINGEELGLTDWHYTHTYAIQDDGTRDREVFRYMSSDSRLRDDPNSDDLFHGDDIHFDDGSLIPPDGRDIAVWASSGPYDMDHGDTLRFAIAMLSGTDFSDISTNADRVIAVFENGYVVKSVPEPIVTGQAHDGVVTLEWDCRIDTSYIDPDTATNTLQGYRIYKTEDARRQMWDFVDSMAMGDYATGVTERLLYRWVDDDVVSGFYYSYAVTAYDSSGFESGIASLGAETNVVELRPASAPGCDLVDIKVVPNPFVISARWERDRLGNPPVGQPIRELAFVNLPEECTIKIFTLDGDLIRTIHHTNGTGTEYWDVRSDFNRMIVTGVYFYHVTSDQGEHLGKIAIIR